jgi:hypothetical protein
LDDSHSAGEVSRHYSPTDVGATLLHALRAAGKDLDALTADDLAPVDQFHNHGKPTTLELAQLAGLRGGERVLDVGGRPRRNMLALAPSR